ncbi:MAG: HU family DNA-binding protein [Anaerolineae bacterium]|nr:MAG: Bacterial DNA-binding protein [Chloroflexi bacterium OLB13]MBW7881007.1 HU family DNA-binding protein [Anaerolineae bacterium]
MSLNKKTMVREIGRRTRLTNRDVQAVIETLIDVWTEELVSGGRIELENFLVMTVHAESKRVRVRASKRLLNLCLAELGRRC